MTDATDDAAAVERDVTRVVAFSDGVFAIAITLLVVSLEIPKVKATDLGEALRELAPELFTYALSFVVVGAYWMGHHRMFRSLRRVNRALLWINLALLGFVALLPFPTEILGKYGETRLATILYAATIFSVGSMSVLLWWYINHARLTKPIPWDRVWSEMVRGAIVPAVFLISIPVAFVDAEVGKVVWFLIWPANVIANRRFGPQTEAP